MLNKLITPVMCALAIFAIGAGIEPVAAEGSAEGAAYAQVMNGDENLRVLPTVTVVATATAEDSAADGEDSVVLANVQRAGDEIAHRVKSNVRRVSLSVPYYAFGGVARRASE